MPPNQESPIGNLPTDTDVQNIAHQYASSIVVPTTKPKTQIIICPVGLVGAGKTTVMKPLSERLQLVRISSDEIRKILHDQGFNYKRTTEIVTIVILQFARQGYSLGIDADCAPPDSQAKFAEFSKQMDIPIIWIHINPPESFIINKLTNYNHTWLFKDAATAIANYERRKPIHEQALSTIQFYFTFDTSLDTLPQQIVAFITKLTTEFHL